MITLGHIDKLDGIDYYYCSDEQGRVTIMQYEGPEGAMNQKLVKMKASAVLRIFEKFLIVDKKIIDPGKDVYTYEEKIKRINLFIDWGHENFETVPASIIDNGIISTKYMKSMINMITPEHPSRKTLIFLMHNVTLINEAAYNI